MFRLTQLSARRRLSNSVRVVSALAARAPSAGPGGVPRILPIRAAGQSLRLVAQLDRNYSSHVPRTSRSAPQRADHQRMQDKLRAALLPGHRAGHTCPAFLSDMRQTLTFLGLDSRRANGLAVWIIDKLVQDKPLAVIEREIFEKLRSVVVDDSGRNLIDAIGPKLTGRATLIFEQLKPHLEDLRGKRCLDFGAGDGQVTDLIDEEVSPGNTFGIDVRPYGKSRVRIGQYDGRDVPFPDRHFDFIVSTNVLHHADNNQQCLLEMRRVLVPGGKLLVIETVPLGPTEEEAERNMPLTFLNDYFYNRLLHDADVPVPGTFETMQGWPRRFEGLGLSVKVVVDLGIDQQIIRDRHCILVVEKPSD